MFYHYNVLFCFLQVGQKILTLRRFHFHCVMEFPVTTKFRASSFEKAVYGVARMYKINPNLLYPCLRCTGTFLSHCNYLVQCDPTSDKIAEHLDPSPYVWPESRREDLTAGKSDWEKKASVRVGVVEFQNWVRSLSGDDKKMLTSYQACR